VLVFYVAKSRAVALDDAPPVARARTVVVVLAFVAGMALSRDQAQMSPLALDVR